MEHFVVPQFIDVESKIIGPISARQFVVIAVTLGLCYVWYRFFPAFLFIPLIFVTATLGGGLAFAKVNGQPLHYFLLNLIQTLRRPRLKLWFRTEIRKIEPPKEVVAEIPTKQDVGPVTESRLAAMSLMVDTGGAYQADEVRPVDAQVSALGSVPTLQQQVQQPSQNAVQNQPQQQQNLKQDNSGL